HPAQRRPARAANTSALRGSSRRRAVAVAGCSVGRRRGTSAPRHPPDRRVPSSCPAPKGRPALWLRRSCPSLHLVPRGGPLAALANLHTRDQDAVLVLLSFGIGLERTVPLLRLHRLLFGHVAIRNANPVELTRGPEEGLGPDHVADLGLAGGASLFPVHRRRSSLSKRDFIIGDALSRLVVGRLRPLLAAFRPLSPPAP